MSDPWRRTLLALLLLLAHSQGVLGCDGCTTEWYFWFGLFLALMALFITLIISVNCCLKRHQKNKIITRKFRIGPLPGEKKTSLVVEAPRPSVHSVSYKDVEKGSKDVHHGQASSEREDSSSCTSSSDKASISSDVVPVHDDEANDTTSNAEEYLATKVFAFSNDTRTSDEDWASQDRTSSTPGFSPRSTETLPEVVVSNPRTEQRHSVPRISVNTSSQPESTSMRSQASTEGEVGRMSVSSSGPILVMDTPRTNDSV